MMAKSVLLTLAPGQEDVGRIGQGKPFGQPSRLGSADELLTRAGQDERTEERHDGEAENAPERDVVGGLDRARLTQLAAHERRPVAVDRNGGERRDERQLSEDGSRWVSSRSSFLLHVNVLARLFRGKFLAMLSKAHAEGQLKFFNAHAELADKKSFKRFLVPLRRIKWVVYCKDPFAGPQQVLRYLSRYTHRVAISNRRLVSADDKGVAFRWKDYRSEGPAGGRR